MSPGLNTIGGCELIEPLGAGGMGEVFIARHVDSGQRVAVKLLPVESRVWRSDRTELMERFRRECEVSRDLEHRNIARTHYFGACEQTQRLFMVMELVPGVALSQLLAAPEPFTLERVLHIGHQILCAIVHAHDRGVVHRDVKPSNVIVGDGDHVKLIDWGVAGVAVSNLTKAGSAIGSPSHMSPEAASGEQVDFRTDQFSFGTVLFEMLTGVNPFFDNNSFRTTVNIMTKPTPSLSSYGVEVSDDLCALVRRLLKKRADERYPDEKRLLDTFATIRRGSRAPSSAPPVRSRSGPSELPTVSDRG